MVVAISLVAFVLAELVGLLLLLVDWWAVRQY
jgi:hypothetical protein